MRICVAQHFEDELKTSQIQVDEKTGTIMAFQ